MRNPGPKIANKAEINSLMNLLTAIADGFELAAEIIRSTHGALDESQRYRDAVKRTAKPLNYEELLTIITKADTSGGVVSEALKRAEVLRFELGKLWISPYDSFDSVSIQYAKDRIASVLKENFGVDFKLRIKSKEQ